MSGHLVTLKSRNFFNTKIDLEGVEDDRLREITSHIHPSKSLEIEILNKETNKVSIYLYGPLITLFEIKKFCEELVTNVKQFKDDFDQIFFQFYHILLYQRNSGYKLRDRAVLIIKEPYCFVVMFGQVTHVHYVININKNHAYYMGNEEEFVDIPFNPKIVDMIKNNFEEDVKQLILRQISLVRHQTTLFQKDAAEKNNKNMEEINRNMRVLMELEASITEHMKASLQIHEEMTKLEEARKETITAYREMIFKKPNVDPFFNMEKKTQNSAWSNY